MEFEARSRETRQRAEDALVRFALLAGSHVADFVVIGGLNPDFLAPQAPVPHLGTTDVDLLFELGLIYERDEQDFAWLDRAIEEASFRERSGSAGWQWDAILGDSLVRIDLLCDVPDSPGRMVALPGANLASAQNLDGPAAALENPITRELFVPVSIALDHPDCPSSVYLKFATLGGYIAAKSSALLSRRIPKDAYDLMFVILYNPDGPRGAARATANLSVPQHRQSHRDVVKSAIGLLADAPGEWAGHFAEQMSAAGDDAPDDQLRTDAAVGAAQFLAEFDPVTL